MRARTMRAYANARMTHRMRTHFSCVMRAFAYVVWASSVSVMRAYARIRMRCERIRIACARIRIACARIACECAHLRGTYACPVLYIRYKVWDDFTYSFPNVNGAIVEVWKCRSNFNPHFIGYMITYPCLSWSSSIPAKGVPNHIEPILW